MPPFDKSKDFAYITPPDNGKAYKQNGHFYNLQFDEVDDNGKVLAPASKPQKAPKAPAAGQAPIEVASISVAELLKQANSMPFLKWKSEAKKILGDSCPGSKPDIITALEHKIGVKEPQIERAPAVDHRASAKLPNGVEIDLVAWASKDRPTKYLFGDVQKAFRIKYSKQIDNERDGINFLIDEGAVQAGDARNV
jgi:hypothetical protein